MRYGPIPTTLPERLAVLAGAVPQPLLDALAAPLQARCLMAAVKLGLVEALAAGPRSAGDLAGPLDPEGTELVLRVLASMGYLRLRGGRFALTALARRTLLPGGGMDLRAFLAFNEVQWDWLSRLEALLETGRGRELHEALEPGQWALYQRAMLDIARTTAPLLAAKVPVPAGATRLLDLGGGHGWLGAALCRRHPGLRSTVLDLPSALPAAEALAREAGIADLVSHRPADLRRDPLPPAEVALAANVLHHFRPAEARDLLARCHGALAPGGTLAVWEHARPSGPPELAGDAAALFFRLGSTASCPTPEALRAWAAAAGFRGLRTVRSLRAPGRFLLLGRR